VNDRITDAIEGNDLDELLRIIDALCEMREWPALVNLRDRARLALERGRQLWPAASHAEYRLALEAPDEYAAAMLVEDAGRFGLGPIAEVAASTHTWAGLAPHALGGPVAALAAHERVVRGEIVDAGTVRHATVLHVPLALRRWEPAYPVATYEAHRFDAPAPELPRGRPLTVPDAGEEYEDEDIAAAFRELVRPWTAASEGRARVVSVEGDALGAIAALGRRDVRGAWLDVGEAIALMAWAGASGGRHGRRRGMAAGRDLVWEVLRALLALAPDEEPTAEDLAELRVLCWSADDATTGWILRLAIEFPAEGVAWVVDAVDQ
jgi:hypothetical protein